jgi:hypothetical protein
MFGMSNREEREGRKEKTLCGLCVLSSSIEKGSLIAFCLLFD